MTHGTWERASEYLGRDQALQAAEDYTRAMQRKLRLATQRVYGERVVPPVVTGPGGEFRRGYTPTLHAESWWTRLRRWVRAAAKKIWEADW